MWIDGGIHSREWVAPATMMYFVKYVSTVILLSLTDRLIGYEYIYLFTAIFSLL